VGDVNKAVADVYEIANMTPSDRDYRQRLWHGKAKSSSDFVPEKLLEDLTDPWGWEAYAIEKLPGEILLDIEALSQQNFMLGMPFDEAVDFANDQVRTTWTQSRFAPEEGGYLMKDAPERAYGVDGYDADMGRVYLRSSPDHRDVGPDGRPKYWVYPEGSTSPMIDDAGLPVLWWPEETLKAEREEYEAGVRESEAEAAADRPRALELGDPLGFLGQGD
jgi:hypothetical protein